MRGRGSRRFWSGADVASVAASGRRRRRAGPAGRRRSLQHGNPRLKRLHWRLVGRFGQLNGPGRLVTRIDLEEAGAVIAARQAVVRAADGEFFFPRAHEGLTRPFPAAVIIHGVNVVEPRDEPASQHGLAAASGNVPPALGGPAVVFLVADRDPDAVAGVVAETEVGFGRPGRPGECGHAQRPAGEHAGDRPTAEHAPKWSSAVSVCHTARTRYARQPRHRYRVNIHGLSTRIARKSFTLVNVGPGVSRSPTFSKNSVELLSFRNAAGSRPRRPARASVLASMKAPAGSSGCPAPPSVPSVSPESAATPLVPASATASASAYSWLGPPRPLPRSVTVSSPPERITARRPCALRSRASRACAAATSRASPSIAVPSRTHSYPAACAASSTAQKTSAGRVASANEVASNTASPGFGVSLAGSASARVTSGDSSSR